MPVYFRSLRFLKVGLNVRYREMINKEYFEGSASVRLSGENIVTKSGISNRFFLVCEMSVCFS